MTQLVSKLPVDGGAPLPLVSIIVTNFNYAQFVTTAVESVVAQTYPNIECVVVDDASTDNSAEVLEGLARRFPQLRVIRRTENGGQLMGARDGLAITTGLFVNFLDADDYLHPDFVEMHISAHLSLRSSVGFSCCDMMFLWQATTLSTCDSNIGRYLASPARKDATTRNLEDPGFTYELGLRPVPAGRVLAVKSSRNIWSWAACSAVMFRRDAIERFSGAACIGEFKYHLDGFFCRAINALSGSVVIDLTLAVYRLHGINPHFRRPPLQNTISFNRPRERKGNCMVVDGLMRHALTECATFKQMFWDEIGYVDFFKNIAAYHPDGRGVLRPLLREHFSLLRENFSPLTIAALFLMTFIWKMG